MSLTENGLSNPSQVILRQGDSLGRQVLLICPPADRLLGTLLQKGTGARALCWDYQSYLTQQASAPGAQCVYGVTWAEGADAPVADHVILFAPKTKDAIDLYIALYARQLREASSIWLVGEKREGVESLAKRLKKDGWGAIKLDSARHCQLWQLTPGAMTEGKLDDFWQAYQVSVPGSEALTLHTLPGVFSAGRLDDGTRLLLDTLAQQPELVSGSLQSGPGRKGPADSAITAPDRVLDFGCGSGVIGLWLKRHWPGVAVEMVDVNALALESSRYSASQAGLSVTVTPSDGLAEVPAGLSAIVTNPPFHQGVKQDTRTTERFLQDCRHKLIEGGSLTLVANRFLPYADWIEASLGRVRVVAEDSRYKVYHAINI